MGTWTGPADDTILHIISSGESENPRKRIQKNAF